LFYSHKVPEYINSICLARLSLNDAWLSGFTDAEGCFSIKINNVKKRYYIQLLFILDQKNEEIVLNKIASLFTTTAKANLKTINKSIKTKNIINYTNTMFRLSISCNDKKKDTISNISNYFNKYPLKTSKNKSFQI
jgi:LAGLIDADG DNA endonuclease family protein